jgi:HEAT repeat protein
MSPNSRPENLTTSISPNSLATKIFNQEEHPESISLELALKILALGSFEERWAIAKVLVKYGELVIVPLQNIVLDEQANSEYRWYALKILSQIENPSIILIVSQLLAATEDEDLISLASETLANQGKQAIAFLSELLESSEYRLLATKALAQIPNSQVITPLLSVVNDNNSQIRLIAITALTNFETPEIIPVLIKALQDSVAAIRKEALTGLGLRGKSHPEIDLVNLIAPLLSDFNLTVCQQAALSLSRLKTDAAVKVLYQVLQSPSTPIPLQITLVRALVWVETPFSIQCLAKCLALVSQPTVLEIITVLGRMTNYEKKSDLSQILQDFYHSDHSAVSEYPVLQALCYSWQQLKAVEARKILSKIATHPEAKVRFHAQSALAELIRNDD